MIKVANALTSIGLARIGARLDEEVHDSDVAVAHCPVQGGPATGAVGLVRVLAVGKQQLHAIGVAGACRVDGFALLLSFVLMRALLRRTTAVCLDPPDIESGFELALDVCLL